VSNIPGKKLGLKVVDLKTNILFFQHHFIGTRNAVGKIVKMHS